MRPIERRPLSEEEKRIVEANMNLVYKLAGNKRRSRLPFEDRVQAGTMGLMRGVQDFDPSRGNALSTYVFRWIKNAIQRAEMKHDVISVPQWVRHSHSNATDQANAERHHGCRDKALGVVGYDDSFMGRESSVESLDDAEEIEWMLGKIDELTPRLQDLIRSIYLNGETRQSYAARCKIDKKIVFVWHGMAMKHLRSICGVEYAKGA
jgi:RNA polymerase sigma factor (sigma-70 family)